MPTYEGDGGFKIHAEAGPTAPPQPNLKATVEQIVATTKPLGIMTMDVEGSENGGYLEVKYLYQLSREQFFTVLHGAQADDKLADQPSDAEKALSLKDLATLDEDLERGEGS